MFFEKIIIGLFFGAFMTIGLFCAIATIMRLIGAN